MIQSHGPPPCHERAPPPSLFFGRNVSIHNSDELTTGQGNKNKKVYATNKDDNEVHNITLTHLRRMTCTDKNLILQNQNCETYLQTFQSCPVVPLSFFTIFNVVWIACCSDHWIQASTFFLWLLAAFILAKIQITKLISPLQYLTVILKKVGWRRFKFCNIKKD